jgi:hypothetical protein
MSKKWKQSHSSSSGFTLGESIPKSMEDRLRGVSSSQRGTPLKTADPRILAGQLLRGEIKVGEIPAGVLTDILMAIGSVHRAILSRNEETILSLREALKGSNEMSRGRDEVQASSTADIERHRHAAQELGRTNLVLRGQVDELRGKAQVAEDALANARGQIQELESQLRDLTVTQLGVVEGSLQRRFLDLVSTELPGWLGKRDQVLVRARYYTKEFDQKVEEADNLRRDLIAAIEDAEAARTDRVFATDETGWAKYLACCEEVTKLREVFDAVTGEIGRIVQRRRAVADTYEPLKREGEQLFYTIQSLAHAFHLVNVNIWERVDVPVSVLGRFEPPAEVVIHMVLTVPIPTLDEEYQERMKELFVHVLASRVPQGKVKTSSTTSASVQFFPGSIFLVEPEREVERLTCLVLIAALEAGAKQALFPDEIAVTLLRAGLSNEDKRKLISTVATACQGLLARGVVTRHSRSVEGLKMSAWAYQARSFEGASESRLLLTQVSGGHGAQLKQKIARLFGSEHAEG